MTATAAPTTIVTTFTTSAPTPIEAEAAAILADYRLARDAEVAAKAAKQAAQDRGNLLLQSLGVSEYSYKGRTIQEVLEMTVEQALEFFSAVPTVARKLETLMDVGLGYIRLGQSATTLSGGEAQRVKLALELSKRDTGRTLYILDEPTTGLHFADIELLLGVLFQLREAGNTIVIIEHNLDVLASADWIVELGPQGGAGGGRLIADGTPEAIASHPDSVTGPYLGRVLRMA